MSVGKITGFFKKLSLSRLPRATTETHPATPETSSSQECDSPTPIVASVCYLEMDPSLTVPFNILLKPAFYLTVPYPFSLIL